MDFDRSLAKSKTTDRHVPDLDPIDHVMTLYAAKPATAVIKVPQAMSVSASLRGQAFKVAMLVRS